MNFILTWRPAEKQMKQQNKQKMRDRHVEMVEEQKKRCLTWKRQSEDNSGWQKTNLPYFLSDIHHFMIFWKYSVCISLFGQKESPQREEKHTSNAALYDYGKIKVQILSLPLLQTQSHSMSSEGLLSHTTAQQQTPQKHQRSLCARTGSKEGWCDQKIQTLAKRIMETPYLETCLILHNN